MSSLNDFFLNLPLPLIDHWGYLIVFLSALIETVPILGAFFPGHLVVIFSGFLAYSGLFRLDAVMVVAFFGALAGDLLAYLIGRRFGHEFMARYGKYFFLNQARYEKTRELVQEHAGKALIIGRFTPFVRAIAPFIAGVSRIKFSRFMLFTVLGGAIWASSSILAGYVFGQGFETAAKYFGRFVLAAVIAIILFFFGYRFLDKRKRIFARYHVFYLVLNGLAIYVFSKMIEDYFDKESVYRLDYWLNERIYLIWRGALTKAMIFITNVFSPEVLFAAALAAAAYFFFKRKLYRAIFIFTAAAGGLISGAIVKILVNRPRPAGGLVLESGFSFPSQHALMAVIFFSLALWIFLREIKNQRLKFIFVSLSVFLIMLVGFSRLYLKVHWFSDIIAGYALGLFWLTFLILVFRVATQLFFKDHS